MENLDSLAGRVVFVTGSAKRVGAAIARRLHAAGANVALHYRSTRGDAESLAEELNGSRPGSAKLFQADLLDTAKLTSLVNEVAAAWE